MNGCVCMYVLIMNELIVVWLYVYMYMHDVCRHVCIYIYICMMCVDMYVCMIILSLFDDMIL